MAMPRQQSDSINWDVNEVFVFMVDSLECEETYNDLLSLCDARKQHSIPLHTHSPGVNPVHVLTEQPMKYQR